ncbi:NAD-dependent epimerase/dehydratase family protein [Fervidobacterium pennivorans subsp. carthaginiensis]|jgi:dihydroflavonol-4-reductase|uniref:NAD-dependent epimerase/dehydratase family protein n=1 Tax=Fervidobacterium pennivorans TaxID=93466 RepID=UPI00355BE797
MLFVTGATGHLGNVLVKSLNNKLEKIKVLVHPKDNLISLQNIPLEVVYNDITNDFSSALKNVECVFHLASLISITPFNKKLIYKTNVGGTVNVVNLCKKFKIPLVYVSSVHALAEVPRGSIVDEHIPVDENKVKGDYAKSKALATKYVLKAFKEGLEGYIVFPTGICGPFDYKLSHFSRVLVKYKERKLKIAVEGKFDFVDVRDVVRAIVALYEILKTKHYPVNHQSYIVSGNNVHFELLPILCGLENYKVLDNFSSNIISYLSLFANCVFGIRTEFLPYALHTISMNYKYCCNKLKETIEYHPKKFEKSVQDFFDWFYSNSINNNTSKTYQKI